MCMSVGWYFVTVLSKVCGGEPCIRGTRIPLWVLYRAKQRGDTNNHLRKKYPILKTIPLAQIMEYAETQQTDLERAIRENEQW